MDKARWTLLGLAITVLVLVLVSAGCAQEEPEEPAVEEPAVEEPAEDAGLALDVVAEWAESGHARLVAEPAVEENCVICTTVERSPSRSRTRRSSRATGQ